MRRAAFYMGRTYTARHLNAVRSPLVTGFITTTGLSMTRACMATSPLRSNPFGALDEAECALSSATDLMLEAGGCDAILRGFGSMRGPFTVTVVGRAMSTGVLSAFLGKVISCLPFFPVRKVNMR